MSRNQHQFQLGTGMNRYPKAWWGVRIEVLLDSLTLNSFSLEAWRYFNSQHLGALDWLLLYNPQ